MTTSPSLVGPSSGDVHPKTSPFDLGLHYGSIILLYPLCFSSIALVNSNDELNWMIPMRIIGLSLYSVKFLSILSTNISISNLISTNT